ncbi:transient receptor potential cation channel protein painless-like, partial [Bradysia coprophila]|uniref:transient receptor potential cation channel protein painless-like n=1 Tax=Bradysia coprophila TaxID=38358 RepID=UPI00187DB5D5
IYSCIELLVKHCADVNLPAENAKTPIQNVLENNHLDVDNKIKLMHCFLSDAKYVDVNDVRTRLIKLLPDFELSPTHIQIDKEWTVDRFFECLHNEKEIEFLRGISFIAMNNQNRLTELLTVVNGNMTLLTLVIEKAWKFSVEKIIRLNVDVNAKAGSLTPVEYAINAGHWEILKLLLSSSKFDFSQYETLLPTATVAQYTDRKTNNEKNYVKCFELLLNHSKIDVNAVDTLGCTALHYAIQYNDSKTIVDVLELNKRHHKTSAVITIFLITYEIFGLLGAIPFWSFSTHYVMLKTVTKNFFKCLLMYAIILVAFTMAFFILFNDANNSSNLCLTATSKASANYVSNCTNKTNPFSTVGLALFKVSTMAIGDIDADSINFNENEISYAVFAGFILLITTILANLLNGLAVSNATGIITEAKQTELIQRCTSLTRFEDGFFNIAYRIGLTKLKSNVIRVRTNQNNRIVGENRKKCCGSARMSDSVVNEAFMLLKRVEMQEKEVIERKRIERQFLNIETLLEKLFQQRLN